MRRATVNEQVARPRVMGGVAIAFALVGLVVSALTVEHHLRLKAHGSTNDACNISTTVSCDRVAGSEYSERLGVPLGVWGVGYFLGALVLAGVGLSRSRTSAQHREFYGPWVLAGLAVSMVLAAISTFGLKAWCPNCLVVYGVCLAQALTFWWGRRSWQWPSDRGSWQVGITSAAIAVGAIVGGYNIFRPYFPEPSPGLEDLTEQLELARQAAGGSGGNSGGSDPNALPVDLSPYSGFGEDYRKGADDARVRLVVFADFQCPSCAVMAAALDRLFVQTEPGRLQVVFKNYPLDKACNPHVRGQRHELACQVAVLARCAGQYGRFWEYHDLAFREQEAGDAARHLRWATAVGLSKPQAEACLASQDLVKKVQDDIAQGMAREVNGTPTVFVNGIRYSGPAHEEALRRFVELVGGTR